MINVRSLESERAPPVTPWWIFIVIILMFGCSSTSVTEEIEGVTPTIMPSSSDMLSTHGRVVGEANVVVVASDLGTGMNRFVFGVLNQAGPIRAPQAFATFYHVDTNPSRPVGHVVAQFVQWPTGQAGVYVAQVNFREPGRWGVMVEIPEVTNGTSVVGESGFVVKAESSAPGIGAPAPLTVNKTAADVSGLGELTSAEEPDLDLYQLTVSDAVFSGKPTLVVFATPMFCSTVTCGPQLDVISTLKQRHVGNVNFIHIEVYDNPHEMKGDFSKRKISPHMDEWGLLTEPFTFVLDSGGKVASKFEGFASEQELEAALRAVITISKS